MIRFLVDESSGQALVDYLRSLGHDVVGVGELMPQALDEMVIAYAHQERRILISNDRDFGEKVFRDAYPHAGVILLRLGDDRATAKIRVLSALLRDHSRNLADRFVVVTERSVRFRPRL